MRYPSRLVPFIFLALTASQIAQVGRPTNGSSRKNTKIGGTATFGYYFGERSPLCLKPLNECGTWRQQPLPPLTRNITRPS